MKLKLKKTVVKNLSKDDKKLPQDLTPQVAGGAKTVTQMHCGSEECPETH